jgi:hypothetical protein
MGEWLLSQRDRLIVARQEVPLQFGHLERSLRVIYCPEGGYRTQPRVKPRVEWREDKAHLG